jgi:hypothetical protein
MMDPLMQAIEAQLSRVNAEGEGEYKTAYGLQNDYDAHPLVAQASRKAISAALGRLFRQGLIIKRPCDRGPRRPHRRGFGIAYAVQPIA